MSVLTVNIGNSVINVGLFGEGGELIFNSSLSADARFTEDEHCIRIKNVLQLNSTDISEIKGSILSSVVPTMTDNVARAMKRLFGRLPIILGPGVKSGLNIRIDNTSELGSDIVAESVAAIHKYAPPIVLVDVGSATVLSAIDINRDYIGCVICPGIDLSIDVLAEKTALLPQIGLRGRGPLIGKNSADSINSGIIYGTAAMIDGLVSQIEDQIGKSSVVATGQYAKEICGHCKHDVIYDKHLLLEGLYTIYVKNTQKRSRN
ncbi:MAG: type III pantothenate kinase [Eubacteriales bacterium]|jgi:type III pantothenate kinase